MHPAASGESTMLDERAVIQFGHGLAKLLLGVHHDGAIPSDRFLDQLARYQQESDWQNGWSPGFLQQTLNRWNGGTYTRHGKPCLPIAGGPDSIRDLQRGTNP